MAVLNFGTVARDEQTVLTVYQQPEMEVQREALARRKTLRVAG